MPINVNGHIVTSTEVKEYQYNGIVKNGLVLQLEAPILGTTGGTTWYDFSGNGNNGTLTNGPTYNSADGGSLVFDGTNDYVNCGNPSSLQLSSAITIGSWVKKDVTLSPGNIVSKNDNNGYRFRLGSGGNDLVTWFDRGATNVLAGSTTIPTGSWNNITVTGDSSGLKIYVNGSLDASNSTAYSPTTNVGDFLIGANITFGEYFDGSISSILVYNRALTSTEVSHNYNVIKSRLGL